MDYYLQEQLIPYVNKSGHIIGPIEKWGAHKKGDLHKGFCVVLQYKNLYLLQHRKHPVFGGLFDLTFSSHPTYKRNLLEDDDEAVIKSLKREWKLDKNDIHGSIKNIGVVYYRAHDDKSKFTEHELCEVYIIKIKKLPKINLNYMYGFSLITKEELKNKRSRIYSHLTPWAKKVIPLL